jgi:kumamolisin
VFLIGTLSTFATQPRSLPGHVPAVVRASLAAGSLPASTRLGLSIGLPLRNQELLTSFLEELYEPGSPQFRHYLTPEEFTERFCPTEAQYQAVINFVKSKGLKVVYLHPNRMLLDVDGVVSDIETSFSTRLRLYQHPHERRMFFAPEVEPAVPASPVTTGLIGTIALLAGFGSLVLVLQPFSAAGSDCGLPASRRSDDVRPPTGSASAGCQTAA